MVRLLSAHRAQHAEPKRLSAGDDTAFQTARQQHEEFVQGGKRVLAKD